MEINLNPDVKNIVIVGGGTAGCLTALEALDLFKNSNITLIESNDIGILGAGEGSTPHLLSFLYSKGINLIDLLKNTKATIKNGIKFTNWNGDNTSYFHPFFDPVPSGEPFVEQYLYEIYQGKNSDNLHASSYLSDVNKVKASFNRGVDPSRLYDIDGTIGIHFDARLMASFLKEICKQRGVNFVEGIVTNINKDSNEFITSVDLDNNERHLVDFIFDCSGFKRIIIGDSYKSEWKSYKDSIPNNRAVPFFIDNDGVIPPYTEAIAMKYGWVWKIPVQGRFGCGYVFNKNLASDEEIKEEIFEKFGEVNIPRVFNFEAGCFKETWVKNCIAIGLSSGFIEPLEATSIWVQIRSLIYLRTSLQGVTYNNQKVIDHYNQNVFKLNELILSFIYLHYITKRTDTNYWENFRTKNTPPPTYMEFETFAKQFIEFTDDHLLKSFGQNFGPLSVISVAAGVNFFDKDLVEQYINARKINNNQFLFNLQNSNAARLRDIKEYSRRCPLHNDFITNILKNEN